MMVMMIAPLLLSLAVINVLCSSQLRLVPAISTSSLRPLLVQMYQELNCVKVHLLASQLYNSNINFNVRLSGNFNPQTLIVSKVSSAIFSICFSDQFEMEDGEQLNVVALLKLPHLNSNVDDSRTVSFYKMEKSLVWSAKDQTLLDLTYAKPIFFKYPCHLLKRDDFQLEVHCEPGVINSGLERLQVLLHVDNKNVLYEGKPGGHVVEVANVSVKHLKSVVIGVTDGQRTVQKEHFLITE
jgi:hypothetical protein